MIARHLKDGLAEHGQHLFLIHGDQQITYHQLAERVTSLTKRFHHLTGKRVGLRTSDPTTFLAAILALDELRAHVFLVGSRTREEIVQLNNAFDFEQVLDFSSLRSETIGNGMMSQSSIHPEAHGVGIEPFSKEPISTVTILTSGTTGLPKAARHTWRSLSRPVRCNNSYVNTRWLCPYPLHLYAGIQVFVQALWNWATLTVPSSIEPHVIASTLLAHKVQYASGTPTFWRQLLTYAGTRVTKHSNLRQITLGGEIAPQDLLDYLRFAFPHARIAHIYACTEMGRLFAVTDGKEGFPANYLKDPPERGIQLRIVDGQLVVTSQNSMEGYVGLHAHSMDPTGWFSTGDLVEVCGERVCFRGRTDEIINIGGSKVLPSEIESVIRKVPGVYQVRVYPKHSSLVGHFLAMDVVLLPEYAEAETRPTIQQVSRANLQSFQIPRIINFVEQIATTAALKISRTEPHS